MTNLDVMIGQMIMTGFRGTEVNENSSIIKQIQRFHPGGVWLVDNENPMGENIGNISSPEQLKKLVSELQSFSQIPLLVSIDAEGGRVIRLKEIYGFPQTYTAKHVGEKDNILFTRDQALMIAQELRQAGINLNLSPVVDLYINPYNTALGGKERCYSTDPYKVYSNAREIILVHHEKNVLCCLKHFPGHGSSANDTHIGFVDVSNTWSEKELFPFKQLINEGLADAILTAHIFNRHLDENFPATLSYNIITGMLKQNMNFEGVVISDDILMGAIKDNFSYEDAIIKAINAGVDIILQSNVLRYSDNTIEEIFVVIKNAVIQRQIPINRIEDAYERIMKMKKKLQV